MAENQKFDPTPYFLNLKGKQYLLAAARIAWLRSEHPDWRIYTEMVAGGREEKFAIYRCEIRDAEGALIQTATKMEDVAGFPDYLEKAETGSIARAVAMCGYGTVNALELDEDENAIADAPQAKRAAAATAKPTASERGAAVGEKTAAPAPEPAAAPAAGGDTTCVVCGKADVSKARVGYCKGRGLPVHCSTCTLPKEN